MKYQDRQKARRERLVPRPTDGPLRVAMYVRVSTEDQADKGTIQNQLTELRRIAQVRSDWRVIDEYVDDAVSGAVPFDERPGGARLLQDAGRFDAVIVYKLDRLGRTLETLLDAHELLEGQDVAIQSATEPFETGTAIGKFVFSLLASLAELERANILERTAMGRARVAASGAWLAGPIPFGFTLDKEATVPDGHVPLFPSPQHANVAREIFTRIAGGATLIGEIARLNALGVPSESVYAGGTVLERGQGRWTLSRLSRMVHNPAYKGFHITETKRGGRIERPCASIIDPDLWQRANDQLAANRKLSKKNAKRDYLLSGLIRCAHCHRGYSGTAKSYGNGREIRYYRCNSNLAGETGGVPCPAKMIRADELEAVVWEQCRCYLANPADLLVRAYQEAKEHDAPDTNAEATLHARLADLDAERGRVMHTFDTGRRTWQETDARLEDLAQQRALVQQELDGLRGREETTRLRTDLLHTVEALAARYREQPEQDFALRREAVVALVTEIIATTDGTGRHKDVTCQVQMRLPGGADVSLSSRTSKDYSTVRYAFIVRLTSRTRNSSTFRSRPGEGSCSNTTVSF